MSRRKRARRLGRPRRNGFTLVEVVVGLVILTLGVLGAVGVLMVASTTLGRADRLERAIGLAEGVLDSLGAAAAPVDGSASHGAGEVLWRLQPDGSVALVATGPRRDTLFAVESVLRPQETP